MAWTFRTQEGDDDFDPKSARLKDLGEHSIRTFVREFTQNSLDVRFDPLKPVKIVFEIRKLDGDAINNLKKNLSEDFITLFNQSFEESDIDEMTRLKEGFEILNGSSTGYNLIIVEKNCRGLTGPERLTSSSDISNYDALCRKVNKNEKDDSNSGGTWGKGSSIYTYSSHIRTWFAYSVLSEDWILQKKRFIGRTQLPPFIDYSIDPPHCYYGTGWFCRNEKSEDGKEIRGLPFINESADKFAEIFGIENRSKEEFGTSFFVPAFNPGSEFEDEESIFKEFRKQVLINYFIPIYQNKLEIIVKTEDQFVEITKDYLYEVEQLKYKLELLDWYNSDRHSEEQIFKQNVLVNIPALKEDQAKTRKIDYAKKPREVTSHLLIRKIEDYETFSNSWETQNQVALVRGRNGMLVNSYDPKLSFLQAQNIRTESILFCGLSMINGETEEGKRHADLFLAYAENPDHNQWCTDDSKINSESYLDRFELIPPKTSGRHSKPTKAIRELLFTKIGNSFREFFQETKEIESGNEINQIFQQLASLRTSGSSRKRENLVNLIRNRRYSEPEIDNLGRYSYHRIVRLINRDKKVEVKFSPALTTWEDSDVTDFNEADIPDFEIIEIINDDENRVIDSGKAPSIILDSDQDELKFSIRTCSISNNRSFQNVQPKIKLQITEKD